jgi:hypothetical protein
MSDRATPNVVLTKFYACGVGEDKRELPYSCTHPPARFYQWREEFILIQLLIEKSYQNMSRERIILEKNIV